MPIVSFPLLHLGSSPLPGCCPRRRRRRLPCLLPPPPPRARTRSRRRRPPGLCCPRRGWRSGRCGRTRRDSVRVTRCARKGGIEGVIRVPLMLRAVFHFKASCMRVEWVSRDKLYAVLTFKKIFDRNTCLRHNKLMPCRSHSFSLSNAIEIRPSLSSAHATLLCAAASVHFF